MKTVNLALCTALAALACACSSDDKSDPAPAGKTTEQPVADPKAGAAAAAPAVDEAPLPVVAADPGPAYFGVDGVGVVRLDASGFKTVLADVSTVKDIAMAPNGDVWVAAIGGVYRLSSDGKSAKLGDYKRPGSVDSLAIGADGTVWTTSFTGVGRYDGKSWQIDPKEQLAGATLLGDIAVDGDNRPWVVSTDHLYRRGDSGWTVIDTGGAVADKPFFEHVTAGPDGKMWVIGSAGVIRGDEAGWTKVDLHTSFGDVKELAIGANGHLAAAGRGHVRLRHGGEVYELTPDGAGFQAKAIDSVAVDAAGRVWLATDNGVVVMSADGKTLQQWLPGTVAAIPGRVKYIAVAGGGPALPELGGEAVTGTLTGKVLKAGAGVANADIEICPTPVTMFKSTPCDSAVVRKVARTDANGVFTVPDLPISSYGFAIKPPGKKWLVLIGGSCCAQMQPGKTFDVGSIAIDG
ncbi:MAG TPA: hypothetical protein VML75_01100 [Kofleriaceae bacterium]|nr:hypothetical protein [Kofleriaceae bacterium]